MNIEQSVRSRYSDAARAREASLCCPVDYDRRLLEVIPAEVIERDYGCGDPSKHLRPGETVLDLGSGTGKICFIAAQVVGSTGRVIGVDMNDEMLALARRHQRAVGDAIGYHNVEFRKGRIQDLGVDLDLLDAALRAQPIADVDAYLGAEAVVAELRATRPLVAASSIDVVVSNCVLNLVEPRSKDQLFLEIFRVLKPGGRAVISDIVSTRPVPPAMRQDSELWSGCISGALTEEGFLSAFLGAGFPAVSILKLDPVPWRVVEGIHFHSMTVEAHKPAVVNEGSPDAVAVVYKGPFREVQDDQGQRLVRGRRELLTGEAGRRYRSTPYRESVELIEPSPEPLRGTAAEMLRDGLGTTGAGACCAPGKCC